MISNVTPAKSGNKADGFMRDDGGATPRGAVGFSKEAMGACIGGGFHAPGERCRLRVQILLKVIGSDETTQNAGENGHASGGFLDGSPFLLEGSVKVGDRCCLANALGGVGSVEFASDWMP